MILSTKPLLLNIITNEHLRDLLFSPEHHIRICSLKIDTNKCSVNQQWEISSGGQWGILSHTSWAPPPPVLKSICPTLVLQDSKDMPPDSDARAVVPESKPWRKLVVTTNTGEASSVLQPRSPLSWNGSDSVPSTSLFRRNWPRGWITGTMTCQQHSMHVI